MKKLHLNNSVPAYLPPAPGRSVHGHGIIKLTTIKSIHKYVFANQMGQHYFTEIPEDLYTFNHMQLWIPVWGCMYILFMADVIEISWFKLILWLLLQTGFVYLGSAVMYNWLL